MSIYTITLKRELLDEGDGIGEENEDCEQANWFERDPDSGRYLEIEGDAAKAGASAIVASSSKEQNCSASEAGKHDDSPADWQCLCGASLESNQAGNKEQEKGLSRGDSEPDNTTDFKENQSNKHSRECLESRKNCWQRQRNRKRLLQEQANQIEHSINVTLEVTANLKQPNRIVWFKNNKQLTSSEKPVFFAKRRKLSNLQAAKSTGEQQEQGANRSVSTKRTISSTKSKSTSSSSDQQSTTVLEEEKEEIVEEEILSDKLGKVELVKKCEQVSSDKGSKLTIHDLQDDDYGQYTCKLIDLVDGHQLDIHTQLKEDRKESSERINKEKRLLNLRAISNMDEVIEVKEGDLNIELGIQILPETNEDEELMSEEEKADFIKNTTISWFKDDVKLNEKDPDVGRLFQFTYDQNEGFHRLIVKKATKETEGLYTCLVENESGTSSCTTQLVVGPGNVPKLTSRLQDVTVYVGQSLEFRIKSSGLPPIDSCQWFRDDKLIIELDSTKSSRKSSSVTSTLSERITMTRDEELPSNWSGKEEDKLIIFKLCIENLKLDDTGRYRCRIINEYGYDETDCFVKVLQEIIEEHEEIEEMIEETTRLGGGKKSTREEEEEEEITTTTVVEEEESEIAEGRRSAKRQRQEETDVEMLDGEGEAPRFKRLLSDIVVKEETIEETSTRRELIVSTERNKWSNSSEQLKLRWFADDREIVSDSRDYSIENFFDETSEELLHKLIIKTSSAIRSAKKFTCRASNSFGEAETSGHVKQARRPRFLRTLEDTETFVGETIVIKVSLDAENSLDDLRFLKDSKVIYSSRSDGDNRRDIVTNSKSRYRVRSYEETVEEEETVTSRYSSRRSSRSAQKRAKTFELTIENVQVDQMGTWECQASNEAGEASCKADIEVFAEPKIVTDLPEQVRVSPGKEIRLTVEASGSPIPVYSWFKDGIGIAEEEDRVFTETKSTTTTTTTKTTTSTTRRRSSVSSMRNEDGISISGETLIIKDARPEDAGSYSCIVENRLGRVKSRDNKLTVTGHGDDLNSAPRIIKDFSVDQVIRIEEGENVILKVLAEGHPKPKQRWIKNDTEEIIERVSRFEIETEGEEYKLKIKRSQLSDSGKYKVLLKNDYGETQSRLVEVKVTKCTDEVESQRRESAPTILLDSQDKVVGLDSDISFDVQVAGHPKPFITWYKNGRRLTESGDGRVSFIEEETITTIIEEEEDLSTGEKVQKTRKETSTLHRLVINKVKESDEAIYSLKAENEFGSTKSSLVSLTVDKRKEAIDELSERKKKASSKSSKVVAEEEEEETTVTTEVTTTTTKDELEDTINDVERRRQRTSTRRSEEDEEDEEDLDEDGKKRTKTRTTRTTTTRTTTTRTEEDEEEDEEEAERRRREAASSKKSSISESDSVAKRSKRRVLVEEEEEEEEEIEEQTKQRRIRVEEQAEERKDEDVVKTRRLVERDEDEEEIMQVDEDEKSVRDKSKSKRKSSKRDSVSTTLVEDEIEETKSKQRQKEHRRDSEARLKETSIETSTERSTKVDRKAPRLISAPKEVTAGLGSSPEVEVEVEETVVEEETTTRKVVWTKNDQPIPDRLLKDSHIELIEKQSSQPGVKKHILRINSLRSSDAGSYKLKVENPLGAAETEPIEVQVDRSMRPGEKAQVTPADIKAPSKSESPRQPQVVSVPEEIVAGVGSSPLIEAELRGEPKPETTWFKDGQPITDAELKDGHLEIVDLPSDKPDITKQALKINNLKPADVAAYHVKAENPLGEAESEPTNLRIDRSMGPKDEPQITRGPTPMEVDEIDDDTSRPSSAQPRDDDEPSKRPVVEKPRFPEDEKRHVEAPIGSSPVVDIPVEGGSPDKIELLKDGRPVPVNEKEAPGKKPHVELEKLPDGIERLRINELRPTDEGVYTLKASNKAGSVESAPIEVVATPKDSISPTKAPGVNDQPSAPEVLSVTEEVVAGPGSEPQLEVVIRANPEAAVTWFKDGRPLSDRQLSDGHLEPLVEKPFEGKRDVCKYVLKVDRLRSTDQAEYHVVAKNPLGTTECKPISLKLDRTMRPSEAPQVKLSEQVPDEATVAPQVAPTLLSLPEEVVAAPSSSPVLAAEIESVPKADVQWFKDGQPIEANLLREGGHLEAIEEPTGVPGVTRHALKINNVKPVDVAAYHLEAKNPLGELESEPINLRLDRSMGPNDEPVVTPAKNLPQTAASPSPIPGDLSAPGKAEEMANELAPLVISDALEVVAGVGSSPVLGVDVKAHPEAAVTWLKDGEPISPRLLRDGHIEPIEESTPVPGVKRHSLKINDARPSDAAEYKLKVENPLGESESEPIKLKVDRSKGPNEEPKVIPNPRKGSLVDGAGEQVAPEIVSLPKEVVAGLGSSPQLEVEVSGKPAPEIQWLKDGQPISERQLRDGHLEVVDLPTNKPDTIKQALKINDLRASDAPAAGYQVKADNPAGVVESEPIKVQVDRSMSSRDKPVVTPAESVAGQSTDDLAGPNRAPTIVSIPNEVVAGRDSSPVLEVEVVGKPAPEITWFKDGQPITDRQLRDGHLEVVDLPTDKPDTTKQALKINNLKPADVAAYHVKAANPLGEAESEPTNVRLDRSMGPNDEPVVTGGQKPQIDELLSGRRPSKSVPRGQRAPTIVSAPEEVVAGPGAAAAIVAEVEGKPVPEITWFKDGQPITDRQLRDGHVEVVDLPTDKPDTAKQALKINDLRPADVAAYHVKAVNPIGEAESEPTNVRLDRSMGPRDEPVVTGGQSSPAETSADLPRQKRPSSAGVPSNQSAPQILRAPEEIVAGPGSSPIIEAEVAGKPEPEITWFKDGQPITDRQLRDGHLEVVDLPTDNPDTTKQALKINNLKPADVAAYHVKAANPLGEAESEPTNVRIDRSMGPRDEPVVTGGQKPQSDEILSGRRPSESGPSGQRAPTIVSAPEEVVAGPGAAAAIVAEVEGKPVPEITWFKDGQPITYRQLRDGHLEVVDLPTDNPDTTKQALTINNLRPADVAAYHVKAANPLGEAESEPTNVRIDRSMGPRDEPVVKGLPRSDTDSLLRGSRRPADSDEQVAPTIVSMPEEIVAGPGSSPRIIAEASGKPEPAITWFKDGQPITERQLRDGHLEIEDLPSNKPDTTKQALKINQIKPADVAAYHVKAENPLGETESAPTNLRIDRSLGPRDEPIVKGLPDEADTTAPSSARARTLDSDEQVAPSIVSMPEEVVAGAGSHPEIIAEITGKPTPEVTWFKDGQPITDRQLRDGHLEVVDLPTDNPDTTKQALKINNLKPADVAAYHVKAENPIGESESNPTNLRIDRSMSPRDEPIISGAEPIEASGAEKTVPMDTEGADGSGRQFKPQIVSSPKEVVAALGSNPVLDVEVKSNPEANVTWFKDGQPIPTRLLRDSHIEMLKQSTPVSGVVKHSLVVHDLRPSDVATYHAKAQNPLGDVESGPIKLRADRSMSKSDEPVVVADQSATKAPADHSQSQVAPEIISAPEEVVAGVSSSPMIEAVIRGEPKPEVTWFKDGQPIGADKLADGHLELVEQPGDAPDITKQVLKINNLKPADVAAYHVKAENPLGEAESEPTNLRIDRSMGPRDEPKITGESGQPIAQPQEDQPASRGGLEKPKLTQLARNIKSPLGSSPVLDVEVTGGQPTKIEWLKDGQVVKDTPDMHIELEQLPDGTQKLQINNMKPADEGVYKVRATNEAGTAESGPIKLTADRRPSLASPASDDQFKPEIIHLTEEVVAGPGGAPVLEVEVKAAPQAELTWFKDGRPLTERQLTSGHLNAVEEKSPYSPNTTKYQLQVDNLRVGDVGTYHVVAKNPLGTVESKPISLKLDKSMGPDEAPLVAHQRPDADSGEFAPQVVGMTEEVVAGVGSSPLVEAKIKARPEPTTTWFKDGQPITEAELAGDHLTIVRERGPEPDLITESLQINDLKPADVAAYHVRAENPLGTVESEPTNLRIDRSMGPNEEPVVSKAETPFSPEDALESQRRTQAPTIRKIPRKIVAALGSNPAIEVEISGVPKPEVVWFKDGRQVSDARGHIALVELPNGAYRLCVTNLKAVDQGDYTVKATNEAGEVQSAPISLVIDTTMGPKDGSRVFDSNEPEVVEQVEETLAPGSFAPKIVRVSDKIVAPLGNKARIEVTVTALPEADVSWYKDGQPIPSRLIDEGHIQLSQVKSASDDNETSYCLLVSELRPSDAAVYHLEAENPLGSARSPSVGVSLKQPDEVEEEQAAGPKRKLRAPTIKRAPRQVVAALGSSPTIEVEVSGEPVPEIVWLRNGKRIKRTDAHFTFEASPEDGVYKLTVNEVLKSDEAVYSVQATNEAGTVESGPISLKVEDAPQADKAADATGFAPQILSVTDEVVAKLSSSPAMEVLIQASPRAEITWFKDGLPLSEADKRKLDISETVIDSETTKCLLKIKQLKASDVAAYHVSASNPFGTTDSAPINVRIDRSPDDDEGSATGARPDDSGASFAPANADQPSKRKLRPPVIKRMPRKIVAGIGSSPVIEIEISGEPKPEIVWFKNGRRVTEVKNHITFEEGPNGVFKLCFTNLKATDQAEYSVTASNEAGTVDSGPIQLVVDRTLGRNAEPFVQEATELPSSQVNVAALVDGPIEAPVILRLTDQEALPGQTVKLEAEVRGNPKPEIKWLKDGDEVELNILNTVPDSNVHSLTLKNVSDLYDGVYSLEAKNLAGIARKDATVKVVDKLSPRRESIEARPTQNIVAEAPKRKEPEEPREKPFIKKGLKFSQVNQGRSIKFEVQIDGKYDELIWMKDGEQINVEVHDGEGQLTSADIDADDDDTSTIVGDDDVAGADLGDEQPGKPKRRFAPKILRRPRNVVAGPGSRIAFEVQFSGEPKPTVVWFKNGERISESSVMSDCAGKVIIEEVGDDVVRLIIEDIQETDVASYQVLVENAYGSERSPAVRLELDNDMVASDDLANTSRVEQPVDSTTGGPLKRGRAPRILSRPKSVHAPPGSKVAFEVQVSGEPTPIVNWFRDGRLITQTSDGHVIIEEYSNGCVRLVLSDITDADVGQYHVVAENKLGSERTIPVTLTIDETSGAKPVNEVGDFEEISTLNDQVERRRRGGRPPRILLRPKHLQATPGSEIILEVNVVGQSKPSIIWYKNGTRITNSADGRVKIEQISEGYQRLILSDVKETDSGGYTVSAENDFGVSMSEKAEVSVSKSITEETTTTTTTTTTTESFFEQFVDDGSGDLVSPGAPAGGRKPRFTVKPRNRKAPIGSKVDFEVCVKGEPKPDVIWYKNGRRIHTTADGRVRVEEFSDGGHKLVIEDLEETDHGVYAAEARNEWGSERTEDVQLRVNQRTEVSERTEVSQRGSARVTTRTKKTRSHYTFAEERHGYVTLTIQDAQMNHDGDYKLIVRNKWGEASTQAPLVVIPKVEPRSSYSMDRHSTTTNEDSEPGRDSRNRRTPFDELEDYGHELDKSVGIFGSESRYQSGDDTYLLQLRDTEFPLRLRKYLRFGARQSPSLRSNLMDAHWGAGARVTIRERRKFREVMDEEIDDEKRGLDLRPTPMRLQKEVGTCGYAAAQLEHLRVEAAERVARQSVECERAGSSQPPVDMMPPFFRVKLKDAVIEETSARADEPKEAVFVCLAAGQPAPEYTWFRNDIIITDVHRMQIIQTEEGGSELHIRDPRLHDSGCFKCVARNVHGNVTSRARLRVASRPSRPEPAEYVSVTAREVFLQWRPPRDYDVNAAETLGYKLEMSQSSIGDQDRWTTLAADIGHEFYVVDDLTPATSYSFRLSARNKFGWSESSYSTYVTTSRADAAADNRLNVPHEMRTRQFTADICDLHLLRQCEDPLKPKLNYQLEQNPIKLNGSSGNERLTEAYAIQAEIARGRFSVIAKAAAKRGADEREEGEQDSRQVIIKAVLVDSMSAAQTKNEFDILRSLQHEKVVRLEAAYKDEDMFVFVMERLSGLDVLTYLSSFTSYNEDTVSKIITQVMDAIEYLHFRGMCLLELLPDNVVMTNGRSTSLKLVDFSSARFVPRSGARVPSNASQNVEYCPPEVIASHEVSTASDVWCIGVLTYVLLSGFSPFKGETEEETRENVRLGRYKYDHIYGNCTPEVTRFLINVFKKHSSKRPTIEQLFENKWLLPNEFMIRKRQQANFRTDKIVAFAEEFHKFKTQSESAPQKLIDLLASK